MNDKILIIEDDIRVSKLLKRGLDEYGYNTVLSHDGKEGLNFALTNKFDLIITDILLPGINGLQVCEEIKSKLSDTPVIMLTALGTTDDKVDGFDAGADDYLVKPFEIRELVARIRSLLKRRRNILNNDAPILKIDDLEMDFYTKRVHRGADEINLTPKEFDLLRYLLKNQGRVISKSEIAEKVWDMSFDTGTNFVEVYISYLRRKIDKNYTTKLIQTKSGMGFILKAENENSK